MDGQVGVHERPFPDVDLRADAVGIVGDREQALQRCHVLAVDEIDRRLEPRLPGAAVPAMGQPSPVNAVDVVAVPPVGQSPAVGLGQRPQRRGRCMDDFCCVDRLQPPSAGLRDGPRLAVRAGSQHLGGDQLDLLAGPLDSRAHPQSPSAGTPPRVIVTRLNRVSLRCSHRSSPRTNRADTGAACCIAADHVLRTMSVARNFSPSSSAASSSS